PLLYAPRGIPPRFRKAGAAPGRRLVIATPGGVEGFFIGWSRIVSRAGRPDVEEIEAHAARFGIKGLEAPARPAGAPPMTPPQSVDALRGPGRGAVDRKDPGR